MAERILLPVLLKELRILHAFVLEVWLDPDCVEQEQPSGKHMGSVVELSRNCWVPRVLSKGAAAPLSLNIAPPVHGTQSQNQKTLSPQSSAKPDQFQEGNLIAHHDHPMENLDGKKRVLLQSQGGVN